PTTTTLPAPMPPRSASSRRTVSTCSAMDDPLICAPPRTFSNMELGKGLVKGSILLYGSDLIDSILVAFLAGEPGFQPDLHDLQRKPRADNTLAHRHHIRIVMFARRLRREGVMQQCAANAGVLVGRDAHADACAADQNAAI